MLSVAIGWGISNWGAEREVAVTDIIFQDNVVSSASSRLRE